MLLYVFFVSFYVFLCCSMHCLFCDVPCIVCVYMCAEQLPPGGYPIAVKYIISYQVTLLDELLLAYKKSHFHAVCCKLSRIRPLFYAMKVSEIWYSHNKLQNTPWYSCIVFWIHEHWYKIPLPFQNNASRHLSLIWREYRGCFSIHNKGVEGGWGFWTRGVACPCL